MVGFAALKIIRFGVEKRKSLQKKNMGNRIEKIKRLLCALYRYRNSERAAPTRNLSSKKEILAKQQKYAPEWTNKGYFQILSELWV